MKQKALPLIIVLSLLAAPLTINAAGQNTSTVEAIKSRVGEALSNGKEVIVKVRPGAKILVGKKEFPFEFTDSARLSGKVTEWREKDFTFAESGSRKGEVTAVISYADVLSIKRLSGFDKILKNVGKVSLGIMAIPVILPLYGILAMLGQLPEC
jgi:hypothetical protein